jgi:hypothetical protein
MKKRFVSTFAILLAFAVGVQAQQATDGNKVKRITFDREKVNIEYADGTREDVANDITIKRKETITGIKAVKSAGKQSDSRWYTIDGRSLQGEPRQKGLYIMRGQNNVKKTVKK